MATAGRIGPRTKLNISQKKALLEMMRQDPKLALNGYSKTERQTMWDALAIRLNLLGPHKTGAKWKACWSNLMAKARANPESDTYKPIMNVIRQCEASLANQDAETVCLGNGAASNQDNVGRRRSRSISMNNNDIEQGNRAASNQDNVGRRRSRSISMNNNDIEQGNRAASNQDNVGRRRSRSISMNNNDIEQGNRAASNQDNVGRRRSRSISMNNNDIEQILHQLTQSNRKGRELGKQIEAIQAEVEDIINKLTRLSIGVNTIRNN